MPKWLLACSAAMPRDSPMQSSSAGSAQVSLRVSLDEIRPEFMSVSASIARTFTGCHCMDTIGRAKSVSRPHDADLECRHDRAWHHRMRDLNAACAHRRYGFHRTALTT